MPVQNVTCVPIITMAIQIGLAVSAGPVSVTIMLTVTSRVIVTPGRANVCNVCTTRKAITASTAGMDSTGMHCSRIVDTVTVMCWERIKPSSIAIGTLASVPALLTFADSTVRSVLKTTGRLPVVKAASLAAAILLDR